MKSEGLSAGIPPSVKIHFLMSGVIPSEARNLALAGNRGGARQGEIPRFARNDTGMLPE